MSRIRKRPMYYRLVGQTAVPCTAMEWGFAFQNDRQVRDTVIGPFRVSTVFLGIDHNWLPRGPALIFETMTFAGRDAEDVNEMDGRWSTWAEAEKAHQRAVDWLQKEYCHAGEVPVEVAI